MPFNIALEKQVIGRTVRYQSHLHLSPEEQKVEVYYWYYILSMFDLKTQAARRINWYHNFGEVNYYSLMGMKIDKNARLKADSPDSKAYIHLNTVNVQTQVFREYVKKFSIETKTYPTMNE